MKSLVLAAFGSTLLTVPALLERTADRQRDMFDRYQPWRRDHQGSRPKSLPARLDTNHDGKVSQEERAAHVAAVATAQPGDMTLPTCRPGAARPHRHQSRRLKIDQAERDAMRAHGCSPRSSGPPVWPGGFAAGHPPCP